MTRTLRWTAAAAFAALFSVAPTLAAASTTSSPLGHWQVTTGEARYDVSSCGGGLCAKLIWLRSDARTPENVALLNHYVVRGARAQGGSQWSGRVTFDGNSYAGTMTLVSKNYMTLRGCSGMLCQTYGLTRVWGTLHSGFVIVRVDLARALYF